MVRMAHRVVGFLGFAWLLGVVRRIRGRSYGSRGGRMVFSAHRIRMAQMVRMARRVRRVRIVRMIFLVRMVRMGQ